MTPRTLAGLLFQRAEEHGDEVGIRYNEGSGWIDSTWQDCWERARRVAAALRTAGLRPGDRVLMIAPDVRAAVAGHFGVWVLGGIPTHIGLPYRLTDIPGFIAQLRVTAQKLDATALLMSRTVAAFAEKNGQDRIFVIEDLEEADVDAALPHPDTLPPPPLVQLTSGSTGHPRAVVIPHERLVLHLERIAEGLPPGDDAVGVTWLPLYHDMGMIGGLLYPFFTRFPVHLLSPIAFQSRPYSWFELISEVGATHTVGPPSAYAIMMRFAAKAVSDGLRLDRLRCAMIGAEPISAPLLQRFSDAFSPCGFRPEAFFPVYGLAEATVAVTFPRPMTPAHIDRVDRVALERDGKAVPATGHGAQEHVGVGAPLRDTELRIVGDDGKDLPERRVGEIWAKSPTLMQGYYREPEATEAAVAGGWLMTGDLGYVAGGDLFVVGRKKEIIIKGGHTIHPQPLEDIVGAVEGIRAGCVAALGIRSAERETERVVIVAETGLPTEQHAALMESVRDALKLQGVAVDEVMLVPKSTLPKTTSGKVRRSAVAEALRDGRPFGDAP